MIERLRMVAGRCVLARFWFPRHRPARARSYRFVGRRPVHAGNRHVQETQIDPQLRAVMHEVIDHHEAHQHRARFRDEHARAHAHSFVIRQRERTMRSLFTEGLVQQIVNLAQDMQVTVVADRSARRGES